MQKASLTPASINNSSKPSASIHSMQVVYSGPIPPASDLEKYEDVLPGAADRILSMAEKQSQHRQKMENTMLEASIEAEKRGQLFGFIIFGITIIAGFLLLLLNKSLEGLISLIIAVGGILGLFIYNRVDTKKELKRKENTNNKH